MKWIFFIGDLGFEEATTLIVRTAKMGWGRDSSMSSVLSSTAMDRVGYFVDT